MAIFPKFCFIKGQQNKIFLWQKRQHITVQFWIKLIGLSSAVALRIMTKGSVFKSTHITSKTRPLKPKYINPCNNAPWCGCYWLLFPLWELNCVDSCKQTPCLTTFNGTITSNLILTVFWNVWRHWWLLWLVLDGIWRMDCFSNFDFSVISQNL